MIAGSDIVEYCRLHQVKCVVFDLYGTLLKKPSGLNPYKKLLKALHGNDPGDHFRRVLTEPLDLADLRSASDKVDEERFSQIQRELNEELMGIAPFPVAQEWIDQCKLAGLMVVVCSNLARPYGPMAKSLLRGIDRWVFSYEVGYKKPEHDIYQHMFSSFNLLPEEICMIGDSLANDVLMPRSLGMHSIHVAHS